MRSRKPKIHGHVCVVRTRTPYGMGSISFVFSFSSRVADLVATSPDTLDMAESRGSPSNTNARLPNQVSNFFLNLTLSYFKFAFIIR